MFDKYSEAYSRPEFQAFLRFSGAVNAFLSDMERYGMAPTSTVEAVLMTAFSHIEQSAGSETVARVYAKARRRTTATLFLMGATNGLGPLGARSHLAGALRSDLQRIGVELLLVLSR